MIDKVLFFTNCQKVLMFLIQHPDKEFFDRQISELTGISKAGTNFALRDLAEAGLILRKKQGRMVFYHVSLESPLIRYLKILQNIIFLYSLIEKIKSLSLRIILFGSASKGENTNESDVDIFIMTREPEEIKKIIFKNKMKKKTQYIINTPNDFVKLKKENPVFYKEIENGIVLWQTK